MALRLLRYCVRLHHLSEKCVYMSRRFLLSEAYSCRDAWTKRLQSPLMQKINSYEFATKLQEAFDRTGKTTAIDMEILANKVGDLDPHQLDFVQNLFYRFRHSSEAVNVRRSMSYALIRALLDLGEIERLMVILKDKVHYGIFLDDYSANLLLDHFLKNGLHMEAGEIATDLMLQEDFGHPLTRVLAWHACHLRLKQLLANPEELPIEEEENVEEEVKYRRVRFIMEPWYDDHFDLPTEKQRLGKTLTMVARLEGDTLLSRGLQLVGWGFYEKFDEGLSLIKTWLESEGGPAVTQSELDTFGRLIDCVKTKEPGPPVERGLLTIKDLYPFVTADQKSQHLQNFQELSEQLKKTGKVSGDISLEDELLKLVNERIKTCEPIDVASQKKLFAEWETERTTLLEEQIKQYQTEQRKRDIAQRLLDLRSKEEKFRYFEKKVEMDLKISQQPTMRPIEEVVEEEQYVAPPGERKAEAAKKR